MAGDANADLTIHGFFQQLGQAGEQVVQAGKALLQLNRHLTQVFRDQPADKTVTRALAALHVFAGAKIRQLLAGAKHKLLLGFDLAGQLRHLLDQPTEIARQGVLGQQFGQVLGRLF